MPYHRGPIIKLEYLKSGFYQPRLVSRPGQNFRGKKCETPRWKLGKNVKILRALVVILPRQQGSEGPDVITNKPQYLDLRSPGGVVKIAPRTLKIGVLSHFRPISTALFYPEILACPTK